MAWTELVHSAVCGVLNLHDGDARARPFYRELMDQQVVGVRNVIERLVSSPIWARPQSDEVDRILADNKSTVKDWLRNQGLTSGYLMGAPE
jgi:hypothetical protein